MCPPPGYLISKKLVRVKSFCYSSIMFYDVVLFNYIFPFIRRSVAGKHWVDILSKFVTSQIFVLSKLLQHLLLLILRRNTVAC